MTNNISQTLSKTYNQREWQTVVILGLIAGSIIGYIFFSYLTVFHLVDRNKLSREIGTLTNEVTALETKKFILDSRITPSLAYEYGFRDSWSETLVSWRGYVAN